MKKTIYPTLDGVVNGIFSLAAGGVVAAEGLGIYAMWNSADCLEGKILATIGLGAGMLSMGALSGYLAKISIEDLTL